MEKEFEWMSRRTAAVPTMNIYHSISKHTSENWIPTYLTVSFTDWNVVATQLWLVKQCTNTISHYRSKVKVSAVSSFWVSQFQINLTNKRLQLSLKVPISTCYLFAHRRGRIRRYLRRCIYSWLTQLSCVIQQMFWCLVVLCLPG